MSYTVDAPNDPEVAASTAGLVYVSDQEPGVQRRRRGRGFSYLKGNAPLKDPKVLGRIKQLAIPPAWTDVWICARSDGHLQATGRDDRQRKQYRYHDDWRKVRDADKFDRLLEFAEVLGPIRKEVDANMGGREADRDTVLAVVVHLLDETLIRVGNPEYAQDNETFGLTTMLDDHAELSQRRVTFDFVGKHGTHHEASVADPRLARIVRRCHELGGKELFTFAGPDGQPVPVSSGDVNDYLRDLAGTDGISAKDFRTWGGTVAVTETLGSLASVDTERELDENVLVAIDHAAEVLHNTRAVCRTSYVHPAIPAAYRDGQLDDLWKESRSSRWYSRAEHATMHALKLAGTRPS